jgi:ATP-dependent protease ClpP protease subunit
MVSAKEAELDFYGTIGFVGEDDDYIMPGDVSAALKEMGKVDSLTVYMNSPGGDVYHGITMANRLEKVRASGQVGRIDTVAEGLVASAATLIFLKGDNRRMAQGSRFMIHEPRSGGFGTAGQFEKAAARMRQTTEQVLDIYEESSALTRDELRAAMAEETFYTPADALEAGFATEESDNFAIAACMSDAFRSENLANLPSEVKVRPWDAARTEATDKLAKLHPDNW